MKIDKLIDRIYEIPKATIKGQEPQPPRFGEEGKREKLKNPFKPPMIVLEKLAREYEEVKKADHKRLTCGLGELGIDILAWYVPFHSDRDNWGIHIPISSIDYVAEKHLHDDGIETLNLAYYILLYHELYHYITEVLVSEWELMMWDPCWAFGDGHLNYNEIEEMLANSWMITKMKKKFSHNHQLVTDIKNFCKKQPNGYRDYDRVSSNSDFKNYQKILFKNYLGVFCLAKDLNVNEIDLDLASFYPDGSMPALKNCPVYLIHSEIFRSTYNQNLGFIRKIEDVDESKKFRKNIKKYGLEDIWKRKKSRMSVCLDGNLRFRKFPKHSKDMYSVNIDQSNRVHLKKINKKWEAIDIGPHTKMGHG